MSLPGVCDPDSARQSHANLLFGRLGIVLELRICGGVELESDGRPLPESLIGGRQGRLVLAYLTCERHRAVRREELAELLWGEELPESWTASLSAVISRLRRLFTEAGLDGPSVVMSTPGAYQLLLPAGSRVDLEDVVAAVEEAEDAAARGETDRALAAASRVETVAARGFIADDSEWVDARRDTIRDLRARAAVAQSAAHLAAGSAGRAIDPARQAVDLDPTKEAAYRQLMLALAAAGERGEALRVWERCRITLVEELGIDPSPETEAVYLGLLGSAPLAPVTTQLPSGVVTFLFTDIVESSALWEQHTAAMAAAVERHDAIVRTVAAAHRGTLLKSKLEGDATVSVFERATECAAAALALVEAIEAEAWPEGARPLVRMAMHTGEAFERGGDYFGPALNRAARIRSLAAGNEILLSHAVAELVRDHLPRGVALRDRGVQALRGLSRGENIFELVRMADRPTEESRAIAADDDIVRPPVPKALTGTGPFVGRGDELEQSTRLWEQATTRESAAVFIGGEPGVGKSRLAGEIARRSYDSGGLVLYGRCDEDLAAPLQPFIEAVRVLAPALGADRVRAVRGVDELTRMLPELKDMLGDKPGLGADPDTERLALFDAVTQLLIAASNEAPVLLVLDDLHWAGKTTLSLLRHLLRGARGNRLLVVGTYRDTELARTHPLAETLADLRREPDTHRMTLSGLAPTDVAAYLEAIGNTDGALGRELAEVTAGNPFFLIEVVRHVEETGGSWQPGTLPEGVREATGRRLSRLSDAANDALSVAAVVGTTFDLALVEQVRDAELVDPITEAVQAGLVVEEPGSLARFRFAHAIVRQVLLSELVSLKRVRLHRTIAELLEAAPVTDPDARLTDLAYHWFECASAGSADKAVDACRRAADRAVERLAYEEAGDLYAMALQALEWIDDNAGAAAELHLARCDALLTAGDVVGARDAIDALELVAAGSERLAAWYTTYEGLLAVLGEPDRLNEIVQSIAAAADAMHDADDLTGEAKARYVHASALERLGQIGAAQRALDAALAAARLAGDRRLADAILAEAPSTALWGPTPVMRASGDCLDVVRVLRITSGTRAVEAVALRCQAVLEALRGRMDAARRMIGSARRTVEELGLTHRSLEAAMAAGLIELLDGQAEDAEGHLRAAYEGLRERRLGGEAAQAGAFLGRALLAQNRIDEADAVAAEAEALAGSDLKAAITWRDVRAEAATRRGDLERALSLAREAVELATTTDALTLVADARLTLSSVLRASGDIAAADAEARRALEACDAKGATVMAGFARRAMSVPPTTAPASEAQLDLVQALSRFENDATRATARVCAAFNARDWDAFTACYSDDWVQDDRRALVAEPLDRSDLFAPMRLIFDGHGGFDDQETIATRGRTLALTRTTLRMPEHESTFPMIVVCRVDDAGEIVQTTLFGPDDRDDALAELDRLYLEGEGAAHRDILELAAALFRALGQHDNDAIAALLAPEFVVRSRRAIRLDVELTASEWLRNLDVIGTHSVPRVDHIVDLSDRGGLWAVVFHGDLDDGGDFTIPMLMAPRVERGLIVSLDVYDDDDTERARASVDAPQPPTVAWFENDATRAAARVHAAFNAHDWDAYRALHSDDWTQDDRRSVVAVPLDRDQSFAGLQFIFAGGGRFVARETIATRGRTCALTRTTLRIPEPEAIYPALIVTRVDSSGRCLRSALFDADDVDGAIAELDRMFLEGEGAERADVLALVTALFAAIGRKDRGAAAALVAPAFVCRHHQTVRSFDELTFSDWVSEAISVPDYFSGSAGRYLHITNLSDRGGLWSLLVTGETGDAGLFELSYLMAVRVANGLVLSLDVFPEGRVEAARAVLDPEPAPWFENDAIRTMHRIDAAYSAHDWDAMTACYSNEYTYEDRRSFMRVALDHDRSMAGVRLIFDGRGTFENEIVATRGRTLSLTWRTLHVPDPEAAATVLVLMRVDATGRVAQSMVFDLDDVDDAIKELDRIFLEAEGAEHAGVLALGRTLFDVLERSDATAAAALFAPEFVCRLHQTVRPVDQLTASEWLVSSAGTTEYFRRGGGDGRLEHIAKLSERGAVWSLLIRGEPDDGGPFEIRHLLAVRVGNGRIVSVDIYDERDADAALAALDPEPWANGAWRAQLRLRDAYLRRDRPAFVKSVAPDWVQIDERRNVRLRLEGDDAFEAFETFTASEHSTFDCELLATREDRLALVRLFVTVAYGATGRSEIELLSIVDSGYDGRIVWSATFDSDDLVSAYAALDERYVEIGGTQWANSDAFDARNWDALATLFASDCTFVDGRTNGWGPIDSETFVDYMRSIVELAPDARMWNDHVRRRGNVHLAAGRVWGTHAGGEFEIAYLTVGVTDAIDKLHHVETYDVTDGTRALARFEELAAAESDEPFANAAWRTSAARADAINARNWDAYTALVAPHVENDDRRAGVALVTRGDEAMAVYRYLFTLDQCRVEHALVATRDDRLALIRATVAFEDGAAGPSEVVSLTVLEHDDSGLLTTMVMFDDLGNAFDELDARHVALGDNPWGATLRHAFDARDWDTFASIFTPDCTIDDHRTTGWGSIGRDAILEYQRGVVDLAPDARMYVDHVRNSGNVELSVARSVGTRDGGPWELPVLSVSARSPDGRIATVDIYDVDSLSSARARFDELVAARTRPHANRASAADPLAT